MTDLVPTNPAAPARRDDVVLPGTADRITQGIPANTQRSYRVAWQQFTDWCTQHTRAPLPTSAATLADYVAHLCDRDKAPSTIKHRMAAISAHNQAHGHPPLGREVTKAANLVLRGYRKNRAGTGQRTKEAPPISRDQLRAMSGACDRNTLAGRRDRLLLVIGWALAGRRSELAALRIEDVRVVDNELEILVRTSKVDKQSEGETVYVPAGEHVDTDPVGLLDDWLAALEIGGGCATEGALFRAVTRDDRLYRYGRLSPAAINELVKRAGGGGVGRLPAGGPAFRAGNTRGPLVPVRAPPPRRHQRAGEASRSACRTAAGASVLGALGAGRVRQPGRR